MKLRSLFIALAVALGLSGGGHAAILLTDSSAPTTSISADGSSFGPVFSADGQRLFFFSHAGNITSNQPLSDALQLFVRDTVTSNTTRLNILSNRWPSDADVTAFGASSNGQLIVFASEANHPALGDTNFAPDIFVHDVVSNATRLVSRDRSGSPLFYPVNTSTNPLTANPMISADGRWVFFESMATTLIEPDQYDYNTTVDVFRRDLQMGLTTLVSRNRLNWPQAANEASRLAGITPDGRFVAFVSRATDLVWEPSSGQEHVYVRDMVASNTVRVTVELFGDPGLNRFTNIRMSENGRFVLFALEFRSELTALYLRDLQAAAPILIATNNWVADQFLSSLTSPQLSADGRFVLYQIGGTNIYRFDTATGTNELVTVESGQMPLANGGARDGIMTPDGSLVLFNGSSPDFTTNNATGWQLYARDMTAGVTRLITLATNGQPSANPAPVLFSAAPGLSHVAFDSAAADFVTSDENRASDVFLREMSGGVTTLISRRSNGPRQTGSGHAFVNSECVSADGRFVVFTSYDNDGFAGDTNGRPDVFIRDLQTGSLLTPGLSTNAARSPVISANGRYVAYLRRNARYAFETMGGAVFRFDRQTSAEELVSSNSSSALPAISSNGNLIAFLSNNVLVVRDMTVGTNHVLGTAAPLSGRDATFTPDDAGVLFAGIGALTPDAGSASTNLYIWNVAQRQLRLVSHHGNQDVGVTRWFAVSGNSRYVAFNDREPFAPLYLHDLAAGTNRILRQSSVAPAINHDGSLVACVTLGTLGPSTMALTLLNTTNGTETQVATGMGFNQPIKPPILSADGRLLVFGKLVFASVSGNRPDGSPIDLPIYRFPLLARDLWFGTNIVISLPLSGLNANAPSRTAALARDGRTVVFHSAASDLVGGDYNDKLDVFAFKLGGGDADRDGLDDEWELTYFDDLSRDGSADYDADRASDRDEFLANTDPTNHGSVFRVIAVTSVSGGQRQITWSGNPQRSYRVEYKDALGSPFWNEVQGPVSWNGDTASIIDPAPGHSNRFYRAVRLP